MQQLKEEGEELSFHPRSNLCDEFSAKTKLEESEEIDDSDQEGEDDDDEEDGEDDFTFASATEFESFASSATAEDMFHDGKIRPVFPLFDQSLIELPQRPPVKNVFVEASAEEDEASGPYCAWSVDAAAATPESCKKSNSTGFSKIWRFREMSSRSNSDGRDAFVFLNKPTTKKKGKDSKIADKKTKDSKIADKKTKDSTIATTVTKKKAGEKGKKGASSSSASAHEIYAKSRAASREEDRRKSYLPYKPELVHGFFTNVHGGMSKNVHPF